MTGDPPAGLLEAWQPVIDLIGTDTGVVRHTESNEAGAFTLLNVQPGTYSLKVTMTGFKTNQSPAFPVDVNQSVTQNQVLQTGATSEHAIRRRVHTYRDHFDLEPLRQRVAALNAAGKMDKEIAAVLNREGFVAARGCAIMSARAPR